jgi:hemerythrin
MTLYKDSSSDVIVKLESFTQHHFRDEENFILSLLGQNNTL